MKNKIFSYRFRYFFRRRILRLNPYTMPEVIIPSRKLERSDDMVENIQRWEDDGGGIVDDSTSTTEKLPVRPTDHDHRYPEYRKKGESQ